MVAAERRLQAHQEAFTMWRELFFRHAHAGSHSSSPEVHPVVGEKLCVSGTQEPSRVLRCLLGRLHPQQSASNRSPASEITGNWKKIASAPNIILEEVALPPLQVPVDDMAGVDEYGRKAQ